MTRAMAKVATAAVSGDGGPVLDQSGTASAMPVWSARREEVMYSVEGRLAVGKRDCTAESTEETEEAKAEVKEEMEEVKAEEAAAESESARRR